MNIQKGSRVTVPDRGRKVRTEIAHNRIYSQLKSGLMNGDWLPGERLVVRKLAETNSTSPMPVREALKQLVSEGAVIDHPNRGVIVPEARVETISDVTRTRCVVEGTVAEWAAATIRDDEITTISALNERMLECVRKGQIEHYLDLNRQFHFAIYRAARSETLLSIVERLWLRAGPWLNIMRGTTTLGFGLDHHKEIIAGLETGDGTRVRRALVADISDAAEIILRAVTNPSPPPAQRQRRKG